ncbi:MULTISPECIES: hypothetical protein [unclassified Streptomyces]|uniref:hypothetical protein n=1 Tax=unclassified Streptomyces TaxID=2593676 RepID=UPI002DDA7F83|nr:hypothetical protein [Streptomyces sp. NBC_01750]WSB03712.1 hypothetical protein OIE54_33250 [Streptomyces sp. NBC_01794]WSD32000.1 hypothetical protein OG966_08810 [Streptomyces sp. NBC_01750]
MRSDISAAVHVVRARIQDVRGGDCAGDDGFVDMDRALGDIGGADGEVQQRGSAALSSGPVRGTVKSSSASASSVPGKGCLQVLSALPGNQHTFNASAPTEATDAPTV